MKAFFKLPAEERQLAFTIAARADKSEVRVYDYVDKDNALTAAKFRRRSAAYRQMGYHTVTDSVGKSSAQLSFG